MKKTILAVVSVLAVSVAAPAFAQAGQPAAQGGGLSLQGGLGSAYLILDPFYYAQAGYGLGGSYQIAVVPEGILKHPSIKDSIAVEAGLGFIHYSWGKVGYYTGTWPSWTYKEADLSFNEILFTVGGVWNFWLTPQLAVYPKLDLGYGFGWWNEDLGGGYMPSAGGFYFSGAAGAMYKLDKLSLRAELGSGMIKLGAAFQF